MALVSSFATSLLTGNFGEPIEFSDAAGMNMLDIKQYTWDAELLEFFGVEKIQLGGDPVDPRKHTDSKGRVQLPAQPL